MTELSIIIVNWNGQRFLPACLKSIAENPPKVGYEVIVVDNASTDGSREWLASEEPRKLFPTAACFKVILADENLGFGIANNRAIESTNSPVVFLLNPDTIVKPGAIDRIFHTLNGDNDIGAVAPKLLNADGSLQPNVWKFPPTPSYFIMTGFKLFRLLPKAWVRDRIYSFLWDYERRVPVPAFSGAAIMAKRSMIDNVGAFDETIHMYGEDAEWCSRINHYGWKTVFEPEAEIYHIGGQSALQRWGAGEARLKEDEAFIFVQKKCVSRSVFVLNQLTRLLVHAVYLVKNKLQRRDTSPLTAIIRCEIRALRNAFN